MDSLHTHNKAFARNQFRSRPPQLHICMCGAELSLSAFVTLPSHPNSGLSVLKITLHGHCVMLVFFEKFQSYSADWPHSTSPRCKIDCLIRFVRANHMDKNLQLAFLSHPKPIFPAATGLHEHNLMFIFINLMTHLCWLCTWNNLMFIIWCSYS